MKISIAAILFILLSHTLFTVPSYAQSLEEIQKKIKESGLSEEELKKKAEAAGYISEDLNKLRQTSIQKEASVKSTAAQEKIIVTPPAVQRISSFQVQEFIGREGAENLGAFGYNVFNYSPTTFEPSLNIPVPTNYVVGPGDEIVISLWGETQLVHNLTVSKNGDIYIPNVGLVVISGLTLKELKSKLFSVLSQVYASLKSNQIEAKTKLDVTTGKLRSVKVYVLGEVNTPGGYTLPSMSSSFTALYYCGGSTLNGSLRNVNVMRGGENIAAIDLYDYLITGSKSKDIRLEDEDIIYVPPVSKRVALAGNAFRPAIYELKENEKLIIRNPHATRPWQHVLEPLSCYLLLASKLYLEGNKFSGGWNFGPLDQANHKVSELIDTVIKYYRKGEVVFDDVSEKLHEANILKLDISKAMWNLKWKPVLNFDETVKFTVDGYSNEFEGKDIYGERVKQISNYVELARQKIIEWTKK